MGFPCRVHREGTDDLKGLTTDTFAARFLQFRHCLPGGIMETAERLSERLKALIRDGMAADEIFRSVLAPLDPDPGRDSRLAELLAEVPHEKAARLLWLIHGASADKKVKKTVKRSLYRLAGKGISTEAPSRPGTGPVLHPPKPEPGQGLGSAFDSGGSRFLLTAFPRPGRGFLVAEGVVNDVEGLREFSGAEMSRKELRNHLDEVRSGALFPVADIDPAYGAFLFDEAYRLTLSLKRSPPQDYLHLKGEMERARKRFDGPPVYASLKPEEEPSQGKMEDLLEEEVFKGWIVGPPEILPYVEEAKEAETSMLVLNETQREARLHAVFEKALMELFSGERRALYRRRLEETAYLLARIGKEPEAATALAVAARLVRPPNPIQPEPFLLKLLTRSIVSLLFGEGREGENPEGGEASASPLILKP